MKSKIVFVEGRKTVEVAADSKIIRIATKENADTVTMSIDDFIYLQEHIAKLESTTEAGETEHLKKLESAIKADETEPDDPITAFVRGLRKR